MALDVKILDLDQKVNFSDGSITNFLNIELPNGDVFKVLVTDVDAAKVIAAVQAAKNVFNGHVPPPTPAQRPQPVMAPGGPAFTPAPGGGEPFVFGGEGGPSRALPPMDEEEEDTPAVPPNYGQGGMRSRTVSANEGGAPANVPQAVAERETDEDGVPGM